MGGVRRVSASAMVPGPVAEAEALWYDTDRWATFVDGFAAVVEKDPEWPRSGKLVWRSTPHGRGTVHERVVEPGTSEFHDDRLTGTQRVEFAPQGEHTRVTLTMEYRIEDANPLTPVVDLLFVRRAVRDALQRTVVRFARERQGDISLP
jgi:hypothetical protein